MMEFLKTFGIRESNQGTSTGQFYFEGKDDYFSSFSPVDGKKIGTVFATTAEQYEEVVHKAREAFRYWKNIPAPKRGEVVRQLGEAFRIYKGDLGKLVSYEMGKSLQEGLGEVQEIIDICDYAVGLSRQLYGLTTHSERANHRMYEQYHSLGVVGIISAFNFPVAVWSWNAMLAWVCGDVCIWKPSEKTPLCSLACQYIVNEVFARNHVPEGVSCIVQGDYKVGEWLSHDERIPLISATGSTRLGKEIAKVVGGRLGRSLLELGGNNAIIITESADLKTVIPGAIFGAIGTAGQRCTSTRRLIIHESIYDTVKENIVKAYQQIKIGNPLDSSNHMGPLIDELAVSTYKNAIETAKSQGARMLVEGSSIKIAGLDSLCYVSPSIAEVEHDLPIVQDETFAPLLYIMKYSTLDEAIQIQNGVKQGLSSAIMTMNMREAENFLSVNGSDCGIANVNIGTSGAEIGGAFGGEKETGGGRESGSDSWKAYMRRQTNTINYGVDLPLAQGIVFDL
jgi:aldehyde dehydrogenase (NAD+)